MGCLFGLIRVELASESQATASALQISGCPSMTDYIPGISAVHCWDNNISVPSLTGYHMWIYTSDDRGP